MTKIKGAAHGVSVKESEYFLGNQRIQEKEKVASTATFSPITGRAIPVHPAKRRDSVKYRGGLVPGFCGQGL